MLLILAAPTNRPARKSEMLWPSLWSKGAMCFLPAQISVTIFPKRKYPRSAPILILRPSRPTIPSRITRDARKLSIQPAAYWDKLTATQLGLYGKPDSLAVINWVVGKGEILWWAGSTPLTNAGITREDNVVFFLNSVGNWSEGNAYHIYWDEYFHGQRSSLWSYVRRTSLAWSAFQVGSLLWRYFSHSVAEAGPLSCLREFPDFHHWNS